MNLYDTVGVEHGGCCSDESPAYIRSEEHRVDAGALRLYQVLLPMGLALLVSNHSNKFCPVLVCQKLSFICFSTWGLIFFNLFYHNASTKVNSGQSKGFRKSLYVICSVPDP
jgi:hypothetical protein